MNSAVKRQVEEFFGRYPERQFRKGAMLIFAGEAPTSTFYLKTGSVRQYDVTNRGDEVVVNVFKPPAFFPMNYVINRRPNEYFYDAAASLTAHLAPIDDVLKFVRSNHAVTFDLLARVYNGIDGVLRRQSYLMGRNADDRLIYELILSCHRLGRQRSDKAYLLELTEAELAARTGLSRETVSRHLQALKKRELVRVTTRGLIVTDITALETLLENNTQLRAVEKISVKR